MVSRTTYTRAAWLLRKPSVGRGNRPDRDMVKKTVTLTAAAARIVRKYRHCGNRRRRVEAFQLFARAAGDSLTGDADDNAR